MGALKTILIGVGKMGRNHLRVLQEDAGFEVVGVVDPLAPDLFPQEASAFRVATELKELGDVEWDCAVCAVPTGLHADYARQLLEIGKPLLLEKPLASSPEQCAELVELAKKRNVPMAVGHLERFNPAVRKLRELLRSGWLGQPIHFSFTRVGGYPQGSQEGNNVLIDLAVHDLDVLHHLVGPVQAQASICHSTWQPGVFDTAEIMLTSTQGQSASIHVNWVTPTKIRTLRVTGTRGVCFVDYILQSCSLLGGNMLRQRVSEDFDFESLIEQYKSTDRIEFGIVKKEPLKVQLGEFEKLVKGEPSQACSVDQAASAVRLADEALRMAVRSVHGPAPAPSDAGVLDPPPSP